MKNLRKKIEEKEELYKKKIDQLQLMQRNFNIVKTETINLEGQISALRELELQEKPKKKKNE